MTGFSATIPALEDAFARTAQASLGAAILILIGVGFFLLFPGIFGPRWRFAFGVVVLARLLLPFSSAESHFSVFNLWEREAATGAGTTGPDSIAVFAAAPTQPATAALESSRFELALPSPVAGPSLMPEAHLREKSAKPAPPPPVLAVRASDFTTALPFFWATGAALIFAWILVRNFRLAREIRRWGNPVTERRLLGLLEQSRKSLGIRRPTPLVALPELPGAAVFGWVRPHLLIAENFAERFGDAEIRGIFLHELTHLRRHDVLWNWLAHLAVAIHWFNPLAWFLARRFQADREQICDRAVLDRLSPRQQRAYGAALISLVECVSGASGSPKGIPALAPFLTRKSELKNRIAMIHQEQKTTPRILHALAAIVLAAGGAVTFTSAVVADGEDDEKKERAEREERRETERERKVEREGDRERPEVREREKAREGERHIREVRRVEHREQRDEHHEREEDERRERADGVRDADPEGEEFISIIRELQERIQDLARVGKLDQARQLEEKIHEMMREHPERAEQFRAHQRHREHREIEHRVRDLQAALREAIEDGNNDRAREIREQMEVIRHGVRRLEEGEHAERRIHHLRQAAENLEAAGLHDQARELADQAEEIERELRQHHAEHRDEELARHAERLEREVADLRALVTELREHVGDLEAELRQAGARKTKED